MLDDKVERQRRVRTRTAMYYDAYDELVADRISMALGGEVALRDPDFDEIGRAHV